MKFKNSILLINFNFSGDCGTKEYLKSIYGDHFKKIIFYSDTPSTDDPEINFVDTHSGWYSYKLFLHFYIFYKDLISTSDGVFYTHDDAIINVNILNTLDNQKILCPYWEPQRLERLDNYHTDWPWWNHYSGKKALNSVLGDSSSHVKKIRFFSHGYSDFFYLPTRFIDEHFLVQ